MNPLSTRRPWSVILLVCALAVLASCGGHHGVAPKPDTNPLLVVGGPSPSASAMAPARDLSEEDATIPISRDDAVRGSRVAFVTIVVFSDFQCPFCTRLETTLDRLREEYGEEKLRLVFKHNPLPFHQYARITAEVAQGVLALAGQDAFWRFHSGAFRRQSSLSAETPRSWAIAEGVDEQALDQGLQAKRWSPKVDADIALAKRLNATGTPASFVNGVRLTGAQPYEKFKATIDAELGKAKALAEGGVERGALYTRLAASNFKPTSDDDDDDDGVAARVAAELKIVHKIPLGAVPTRGPSTALVTIVVFSDFQCPFCKRAEETLARIRREYGDKVRVAWRDTPLAFHPRAEPAAELARAARAQQGDAGFWTVHGLLFDSQPKLEDADLERIAREAKLDVGRAMAAVKAKSFKKGIDEDIDVGDDFKAGGTPHFFVNGRRMAGAQAFEKFKPVIDEEITKAEALVRQGTPRTGIYEALTKDGKTPPDPERKELAAAPATAPFRGAANAKVIIQEVSDFQCPFCKRADVTMEEVLKAYPGKIKIVWRDKPLPMHSDAGLAAEAAREAFAQKGNDGFWKMHKLLFENQQVMKRDDLDGYAKKVGLDMVKFAQALDSRKHKPLVDADDKITSDAGVSGVPAFFVGPYYISGALPFAKFRKLVELALNPRVAAPGATLTPAAGLIIKDITPGTGAAVKSGDKVKVHYVGTLTDGTEFDQSRKRGQPFSFEVGKGRVIKGWDQGLVGMKVGGKRRLTIPPDLAYGDRGVSAIPPKSTLIFEIELIEIE